MCDLAFVENRFSFLDRRRGGGYLSGIVARPGSAPGAAGWFADEYNYERF
jgi:hypothetical protein